MLLKLGAAGSDAHSPCGRCGCDRGGIEVAQRRRRHRLWQRASGRTAFGPQSCSPAHRLDHHLLADEAFARRGQPRPQLRDELALRLVGAGGGHSCGLSQGLLHHRFTFCRSFFANGNSSVGVVKNASSP